ncbi:MAG: DUF4139 domain-containing protein [Deltaproteobacteria bacterium]|nr:DUF4139 domain-containing protein [Deltaproteobacteria bacterium]
MRRISGYVFICLLLSAGTVLAADKVVSRSTERKEVSVTVYNKSLALVREVRDIEMPKGEVVVEFEDVAQKIKPETVAIKAIDSGRLDVLEQNYEYDLLTPTRLMEKYEGRNLELIRENPKTGDERRIKATLLSNHGGGVYRTQGGITFGDVGRPLLPDLPDNFVTHPTLRWMLHSAKAGKRRVEAAYLTTGMSWKADYVLVLDKKDRNANLNGWVTLKNDSGATFENANLALVAGDVHQVQPEYSRRLYQRKAQMNVVEKKGFQEEGLFEYHLYNLGRPTTVADKQQKQVSLLEASDVRVRRVLKVKTRYLQLEGTLRGGDPAKQKVEVFIEFANDKKSGLGMPIPAGVVRVYKADSRGGQQFLGEDRVDHTPRDEKVEIKVGNAFDLVAQRRQTDYKRVSKTVHQTEWEVKLRNHKKEAVKVEVIEPMNGDWEVLKSSHKGEREDAGTLRFILPVKPDGETVLTYRVQTKI